MVILHLVRRSLLSSASTIRPIYHVRFANTIVESQIKNKELEKKEKVEKTREPDANPSHKARIRMLKEKYASNPAPLMEFFDSPENWGEMKVRVGREWRVEELRVKSNTDLHKLWYILLKERNMLLTMAHEAEVSSEYFPNPERQDKVDQSMINIETVVRERNKAYMELEVGEGETYERPSVFRPDLFGRHRNVSCSQHLVPYRLNTKFRELYGPGKGKHVDEFIALLREQKARRLQRRTWNDCSTVRQLLRRFPDLDMDYLQELYPRVPVKYFKDHLDRYREVEYISKHTAHELKKDNRVEWQPEV